MKDTLADIRDKLQKGFYQNEEHVRFSLVARVLQELGWNIWDPKEVNAEFVAVPKEDRTKVDVALFASPYAPSVFIEVKAHGGIRDLHGIETQLRDYNRNNTAPFSIITDGAKWRFYYSQTAGEFSSKCFKAIDLLSDDLGDVEGAFMTFLLKDAIINEAAEEQAKTFLKLNQKQKLMEELLARARRMVLEPPYPSLPEVLVRLVAERNVIISTHEASEFLAKASTSPATARNSPPTTPPQDRVNIRAQDTDAPDNLNYADIVEARIGTETAKKWNRLVGAAIRLALQRGLSVDQIGKLMGKQRISEGTARKSHWFPVKGTNVSVEYYNSNIAWPSALTIARELGVGISVRFRYNNRAAHPGQEGMLSWSPEGK